MTPQNPQKPPAYAPSNGKAHLNFCGSGVRQKVCRTGKSPPRSATPAWGALHSRTADRQPQPATLIRNPPPALPSQPRADRSTMPATSIGTPPPPPAPPGKRCPATGYQSKGGFYYGSTDSRPNQSSWAVASHLRVAPARWPLHSHRQPFDPLPLDRPRRCSLPRC